MRFTKYNDEWNTVKLGDLMEKGKAGGTPTSSNKDYYGGTIPFLSINDMTSQGKYITYTSKLITQKGLENSSAWILPKNSLLYSIYASVGFVGINLINMATSQAIYGIILKKEVNIQYLYYYLLNFKRNLHKYIETGTQGNINAKILKNFKINIPSLDEQGKIASFLSSVDNKIELLKDKKDKYVEFKHYLLQNLFPRNDELTPKLRFEEFTEEWKSVQIKDIFSERNETNFDELALLSVTLNNGVIPRSEIDGKDNSINNKNNYKHVKPQDIVYNSMRMWQGANGVSTLEGIVSPAYTVLIPKKDICSDFYGYYFKINRMLNEFKKYSQGLTSDTWNLKYPLISQITIKTTSREEQEKIASFLSFVDKKIDLLYQEIEQVEEYKKGLLQKMFI